MTDRYESPWDPPRWWRRTKITLGVVAVVGVSVGFPYGVIYHASKDFESSDIGTRASFVEFDGREVLLVAYTRDGGGGILGVPYFVVEGSEVRAAAVETATGTIVWDERIVAESHHEEPALLAADTERTYVASDYGLTVVDTATGDVIAQHDDITGLDDVPTGEITTFDYDVQSNAVVALTNAGTVVAVPVGSETAYPAADTVAQRWVNGLRRTGAWCEGELCPLNLKDGIVAPSGVTLTIHEDLMGLEGIAVTDETQTRVTILGRSGFWSM